MAQKDSFTIGNLDKKVSQLVSNGCRFQKRVLEG